MKIGFAARWSPLDKRSWSGTSYYSFQQIRKNFETEIYHYKWTWRVREWLTTQKSFNRKLFGKQTSVEFLRSYAKYFSHQLEKDLKKKPVDVLFVSASSQLIAYLDTRIPIVYMTDATFQQLQGYYPNFSNLPEYNVRQGIELDKKAFLKSSHCLLASEWNKRSAVDDYGVEASRVTVSPCGANLDNIPSSDSLNYEASGKLRLLFLGVEWERKGGDIVLDSFRQLKKKNYNPQLYIIGCTPPVDLSNEKDITVIPFLDKNNEQELRKLEEIYRNTDLLFLPTRAECAGVVFSESSAYGIPSITTDTGGVTTYVKNGVNGYTLPMEADGKDYADQIENIFRDKSLIQQLKRSSRQYFDEYLSWENWGKDFVRIVKGL